MGGVAVETVFAGRQIAVRAPLRGAFQVGNIGTAVAVCDALRETGIAIDAAAVARGCAGVRWSGRMDWIEGTPPVLIDGAHNPAGMAAMVASARELIGGRRRVAVFATMRNKDAAAMAAGLAELAREVIVTAPAVERAARPEDLAVLFDPPAPIAHDVATALERARESPVATGSWWSAGRSTSPARR